MNVKKFFNSAELETISSAIKDAEKRTGGELVLRIDTKSDDYSESYWKSGALFLVLYLLAAVLVHMYRPEIQLLNNTYTLLTGAALFFLTGTAAAVLIPPYRRLITGRDAMRYYVDLKAHEAFLHEEVFNTKLRTGILIYLSLFEKTAVIIGDSGINSKVKQEEWETIASSIASGIKDNRKAEAITRSIKMCGDLLVKSGVQKEIGDTNELSNDIRIGR
ncbi:MAG: hypothetical protein MUC95_07535 [Spirochaetes bacterium]|nr:hypothetical protein [Spirochaetota bacterium]